MRIQRYLVRKGLTQDQDKAIPKHFTQLLSVHDRANEIKPVPKLTDSTTTRGVTSE